MDAIGLADARAHLSELIDKAGDSVDRDGDQAADRADHRRTARSGAGHVQ